MGKQQAQNSPQQFAPQQQDTYHVPVLFTEVLNGLQIKPDGIYVDCTMGGAGHTLGILQQLGPNGILVAFDQDADAKANLPQDARVIFIPQNFKHVVRFLRLHKIGKVDGLLADLGVSSHQFNEAARGFSTRFDAPLDMRMDTRTTLTAAQVVATYTQAQLHKIFEWYGEVTNAKTLAATIVAQRQIAPINTISEFKAALHGIVKGNPQKYFAQVFQALRIEVNQELEVLKELLVQIPEVLKPNGIAAIITFHSLEDRLVKQYFKNGNFNSDDDVEVIYGTKAENPLQTINKKPITATAAELKINGRSRSAKLRLATKK
jgi:16S rRNA (cytosine1402-N4)-methyltransferase